MARGHPPRPPLRRYACSGQSGMRRHIPPPSPRLPPGGPAPPLPPARRGSGLRRALAWAVPARLAGSAYRGGPPPAAPPPPLAPRRLAAGSAAAPPGSVPGASPWSLWSPLLAPCGLVAALRVAAGSRVPLGGPPRRVPPGPPGPPPALACPSLGWWPGPALGSAAPRPGLVRGSAALFSAPGPGGGGCGVSAAAAAGAAAIGPLTGR